MEFALMWENMDIDIVLASKDETPEILGLQKIAYRQEAILYEDWTIRPLTQTLCEIRAEFDHSAFLAARQEGRLVGSVRAKSASATCRTGRLIVHPDCRRQGIGTLLMKNIEVSFPCAKLFELFTGTKSIDNIRLYTKLSYREYRRQDIS